METPRPPGSMGGGAPAAEQTRLSAGPESWPGPVTVYEHEPRGTVRDLVDAGKNTPGVIRPVHMHEHGGIRLNTEGSHDDRDSRHLEIRPESGVGRPAAILGVNKHGEG